jgi:hypothetical protein
MATRLACSERVSSNVPPLPALWPISPLESALHDVRTAVTPWLDFVGLHSREHSNKVQFYAFDVFASRGDDPLSMRKINLAGLLARYVDDIFFAGFEGNDIEPDLFRHGCLMGLEGLVSNRNDRPNRACVSVRWLKVQNPEHPMMQGSYLRGMHLDERLRRSIEAVDNPIRRPPCGGWADVSDLGSVTNHAELLRHPAINQRH